MKLPLAAIAIFAFTELTKGHELRGSKQGSRKVAENCFHQLFSHFNAGLCMAVSGEGSNSRVKLAGFEGCSNFCTEDNGLIRLADTTMCLQASYGSSLEDGSKMRLYPCDQNNTFQQFAWIDDGSPRRIVLKSDQYSDLCATNRGVKAVKGDSVILKNCDSLYPVEHQKWFGD